MEFKEFSDALVRLGYQFSQPIVSLMFTNLDINHAGFLDLNGFIKACTVIQIVMMKMQQYDPQKRGCVTLDVNQMMDVVFSIPMWSVFSFHYRHIATVLANTGNWERTRLAVRKKKGIIDWSVSLNPHKSARISSFTA